MTETALAPAPADAGLDLPAPAPLGRPRQLVVACYLAIAAASMLLAGLLGAYLHTRDATPAAEWPPPDVHLPNMALLTLTITLLMSAVTAGWISRAGRDDDVRNQRVAVVLTVVLALAHINGLAWVWGALELPIADTAYASLLYAVTGTHTVLVALGIAGIAAVGFRGFGGQLTGPAREPATAAVVWWQFVVVSWLAVYAVLFLLK